MSSLTDIIFLLLIFFMLTSSLIIPNALNLKLPGKASSSPPSKSQPAIIKIERNGTYFYNGEKISLSGIESRVRTLKKGNKKTSIVVSANSDAAYEKVVAVLDLAYRIGVNAILAD